jgi:hypothetical protein
MYIRSVRQVEIHAAEPILSDPSPFDVETATGNLKEYKSLSSNDIPTKLIQA